MRPNPSHTHAPKILCAWAALLIALLALSACSRPRLNASLPIRPASSPEAAAQSPGAAASASAGESLIVYLRSRELMVPVDGVRVAQVPDDFSAGRSGRSHNAHDIMARRGTPVLSADDGAVIRLASNELGGLTIYALDPSEKLVYYYAHLDRYAAGLTAGSRLKKGEVIGYVGSSGNASESAPHLHFQVARLDDPKRHWEGVPIDARAFFALDGRKR